MKVLVIEDEPQIRDIFAEFVELLGHEADVAVDGREGLARFDPLVHKIVVTDFLMPGLTGLEIAEVIRARSRTTPIVMISGSAAPHDERDGVRAELGGGLQASVVSVDGQAAAHEHRDGRGAGRAGVAHLLARRARDAISRARGSAH